VLLRDVIRFVSRDCVDAGLWNADHIGGVLEGLAEAVNRKAAVGSKRLIDLLVQSRAERPAPSPEELETPIIINRKHPETPISDTASPALKQLAQALRDQKVSLLSFSARSRRPSPSSSSSPARSAGWNMRAPCGR
jgi:hypothetical protein